MHFQWPCLRLKCIRRAGEWPIDLFAKPASNRLSDVFLLSSIVHFPLPTHSAADESGFAIDTLYTVKLE